MDIDRSWLVSEDESRNEILCVIGFVISIAAFALSCFGLPIGLILFVMDLYFASQGLKSSRRKFAIATFIISGLSFCILLLHSFIFHM